MKFGASLMTMRVWRVVCEHHAPAAFIGRQILLSVCALWSAAALAIPPNTPITNTAAATYQVAGAAQSVSASHTVVTDPASGNSPPTGISLAPNHVAENAPGATIGAIAVVDPDPSDPHTYAISDPRFEIVGGQLRLTAGTALDFETEPSVALTVTTTDPSGASVTINLTVVVDNRNETPLAVTLAKTTFDANSFGAPVGALTVVDPDVGDTHTYSVDDPRFEVVNGTLQLVATASFPLGGTVTVTITATDAGGLTHAQSFALTATPPGSGAGSNASIRILEDAPTVAGLGTTDVGATQCSASADPSGPFQVVPTPTALSGAPLPVPGAVELRGASVFKTGTPVFVEVSDANANADPAAQETILVALTTDAGDAETLRLLETGVDSSTFAGYIDSVSGAAVAHDCAISGGLHVTLSADYVDADGRRRPRRGAGDARSGQPGIRRGHRTAGRRRVDRTARRQRRAGARVRRRRRFDVSGERRIGNRRRRRRRCALHVCAWRISLPVARARHIPVAGHAAAPLCVSVSGVGCVDSVDGRRRAVCVVGCVARRHVHDRGRSVVARGPAARPVADHADAAPRSARSRSPAARRARSVNRSPPPSARTVRRSIRRRRR